MSKTQYHMVRNSSKIKDYLRKFEWNLLSRTTKTRGFYCCLKFFQHARIGVKLPLIMHLINPVQKGITRLPHVLDCKNTFRRLIYLIIYFEISMIDESITFIGIICLDKIHRFLSKNVTYRRKMCSMKRLDS